MLLNQLVLRYKEALAELLEQALPLAVQRVHALLPPDWDWSGQWGTAGGPATPGALRYSPHMLKPPSPDCKLYVCLPGSARYQPTYIHVCTRAA